MPDRDNASFCRPRLYDADDPEARDDVALVLEALDAQMDRAIANNNKARLAHAAQLMERIISYAGDAYREYAPEAQPEAGA